MACLFWTRVGPSRQSKSSSSSSWSKHSGAGGGGQWGHWKRLSDFLTMEAVRLIRREGLFWSTGCCWLQVDIAWWWKEYLLDLLNPTDYTFLYRKPSVDPLTKGGAEVRGVSLLSLLGKVWPRALDRGVSSLVKPQHQEQQWGFRPGRGPALYSVCIYSRVVRNEVYICFVELEEALDHVPRWVLWWVLWDCELFGPCVTMVNTLKACDLHNRFTFQCPPKVCLGVIGCSSNQISCTCKSLKRVWIQFWEPPFVNT